jgi:hypothetical protein
MQVGIDKYRINGDFNMEYLIFAAGLLAFMWFFWGMFVLVMGIYRAHLAGRLTKLTTVLGLPFVIVGYAVDIFANLVIAPVLFLDLPREFMVTSRFVRYNAEPGHNWRKDIATYVCENMLDVFDPTGNHC